MGFSSKLNIIWNEIIRRCNMKTFQGILAVVVLFGLLSVVAGPCFAEGSGLRYSITVSKFENRSGWSGQWDLGHAWGAVLTDSLNQTGRFIVLGEKDMRNEAMQEQDLASSGRTAGGGKVVVTGQMTPAQLLVKGEITHFEDGTAGGGGSIGIGGVRIGAKGGKAEINVVMYIVDSTTGQVMASKKCYGEVTKKGLSIGLSKGGFNGDIGGFKKTNAGKAIEMAVDEGVAFLTSSLSDIPWTGKVVLVNGNTVYINRGAREGVSVGQAFNVGTSTVLRDPDTGEILDETVEKVATIQAKSVKEKIATCEITQGSGVEKGMTVTYLQ
jgi:curli biogenesis system outer membrane secretion channel CsgG